MTSNETLTGERSAVPGAYPPCLETPAGDGLTKFDSESNATERGRDDRTRSNGAPAGRLTPPGMCLAPGAPSGWPS
jgi:hypothetical protein